MLTPTVIAKALEHAAASTAASTARGLAMSRVKELLAQFSNDAQFQAAVAADREQILWTLHAVAIAVGRVVLGRELDGEQAVQALLTMARDPATVRRFRALLNEAAVSTDDRVAMLAAGYFVGSEQPALTDRLDWAVRGLFPADAHALAELVKADEARLRYSDMYLHVSKEYDSPRYLLSLGRHGKAAGPGRQIDTQSLLSLSNAECITLGDWMPEPRNPQLTQIPITGTPVATPNSPGRWRAVEVLPLGHELHRTLAKVDWREIARRRKAGAPSAPST